MTGKPGTVYVLVDPRGDTIRYVGQTTRPLSQRLSGHLSSRGVPVAEWVAELRTLGLRPEIRPVLEDVPNADLVAVEQKQIMEHIREGWPLLNAECRNLRMPDVRVARRRVEKTRAIGGDLLRQAEESLDKAATIHARDLEMEAHHALRMALRYPEEPSAQREAVIQEIHQSGNEPLLRPEGWEHFADVIVSIAAALKPHGYSFRDVMQSNLFRGAFYMVRSEHREEYDPRVEHDQAA